jgi:hypothetical protein
MYNGLRTVTGGPLDSGDLGYLDTYDYTFQTAGTVTYNSIYGEFQAQVSVQ